MNFKGFSLGNLMFHKVIWTQRKESKNFHIPTGVPVFSHLLSKITFSLHFKSQFGIKDLEINKRTMMVLYRSPEYPALTVNKEAKYQISKLKTNDYENEKTHTFHRALGA